MSNNDPAFPQDLDIRSYGFMGLSKLDWFAGMALQTLRISYSTHAAEAARLAFDVAEAMLAESEKRK